MKTSIGNGVARPVFSFDRLGNLFVEARSFTPPSQLHGLLCGQLSAGMRPKQQSWLESAASQMSCSDDLSADVCGGLIELYDYTLAELSRPEFSFVPLLPDSDTPLTQQVEALGQWCSGFLSGFGLVGITREQLSEEASAALTDIAQISLVEADQLEDDEESERNFFEVCEHVRIVTLVLFNEYQSEAPGLA